MRENSTPLMWASPSIREALTNGRMRPLFPFAPSRAQSAPRSARDRGLAVHGCGTLHKGVCRVPQPYNSTQLDIEKYRRNVRIWEGRTAGRRSIPPQREQMAAAKAPVSQPLVWSGGGETHWSRAGQGTGQGSHGCDGSGQSETVNLNGVR